MRRMMKLADSGNTNQLSKQNLEINPSHPIVRKLAAARTVDADAARDAAEQMYDNALIAAGLLDDPRTMLNRLNVLLERSLSVAKAKE